MNKVKIWNVSRRYQFQKEKKSKRKNIPVEKFQRFVWVFVFHFVFCFWCSRIQNSFNFFSVVLAEGIVSFRQHNQQLTSEIRSRFTESKTDYFWIKQCLQARRHLWHINKREEKILEARRVHLRRRKYTGRSLKLKRDS